MKNLVLFCTCTLLISTSGLIAQSEVKNQKLFEPYWEMEVSLGGVISGSKTAMEDLISEAGYGGVHATKTKIGPIEITGPGTYPRSRTKPSYFFTLRYQFDRSQGLTAKYGIVENYKLMGYKDSIPFALQNKLTSASILYTLSTPNQRLKASAGPSYSWLKSSSGGEYFTDAYRRSKVSGVPGCRLNLSFAFVRIGHFYLAYFLDANLAGKVKLGPYDTGSGNWSAPDLPVSSLNHGFTIGLVMPSGLKS